jgi:hypothetical protein
MNDRTNRLALILRLMDADDSAPPPSDELDGLLREWHHEHAALAAANREEILATIAADGRRAAPRASTRRSAFGVLASIGPSLPRRALRATYRIVTSRSMRAAACLALAALFATITLLPSRHGALAATVNVAEGGELTAFGQDGDRLGPCPLQHTDVAAEVSGPVTRVTVRQRYANPYPQKIEATYTFPLSHRAAVDTMRITVRGSDGSERIVDGEVKERDQARRMYEDARRAGHVASLLEQERRNIFTQSVANIEPGASVTVEISYVEFLLRRDGEYHFAFPMVVAPRYIPGSRSISGNRLPDGLVTRAGVVLLAPAELTVTSQDSTFSGAALQAMIVASLPIRTPSPEWMERPATGLGQPIDFVVTYGNGSKEPGQFFSDAAVGQVNGRWFFSPTRRSGTGFASDTNQVVDASRITPMPNKPSERAGHEVSLSVTIDSGGMALADVSSELHEIVESTPATSRRRTFELKSKSTIPNRDFVMSWRAKPTDANELVGSGTIAHLRTAPDDTAGGYFAVLVEPPTRPSVDQVMPRELIFVVDVSGSMQGFPIEKSKEVIAKALAAMRPSDTFNIITFASGTQSLWGEPRTATDENRRLAKQFVDQQQGGGGTEMLPAFEAALSGQRDSGWMSFTDLLNLPADGRSVRVEVPQSNIDETAGLITAEGKSARVTFGMQLPSSGSRGDQSLQLSGRWVTDSGERMLVVDTARYAKTSVAPNRIVVFLTDGQIGNDGAIVDMVRQNAKSTRVFAFGIGNSVNRALLNGVADAGRGVAEVVTLQSAADSAVARLTRRLETPILVDIDVAFNNIEVSDVAPSPDRLPDLYDESPLVLVGRYVAKAGVAGSLPSVTVRGRNANGPWERTLPLEVSKASEENTAVASLWARLKVDALSEDNEQAIAQGTAPAPLRNEIVRLGERYRILTPLTSFVAIEKSRVTVGGQPMLVQIPIELPEGASWKGLFGEGVAPAQWAGRVQSGDPSISVRRIAAVTQLAAAAEAKQVSFVEGSVNANGGIDAPTLFFAALQQVSAPNDLAAEAKADKAIELIAEKLRRVRDLQLGSKHTEALKEIDEVLAIDPHHSAALALHDILVASQAYRRASPADRMQSTRTWEARSADSLGELRDGSPSQLSPGKRSPRSVTGLMEYPEDWPEQSEATRDSFGRALPLLGDTPILGVELFRSESASSSVTLHSDLSLSSGMLRLLSRDFDDAPEFNLSWALPGAGGFGGGGGDVSCGEDTNGGRADPATGGIQLPPSADTRWLHSAVPSRGAVAPSDNPVSQYFVADPRKFAVIANEEARKRLEAPVSINFKSQTLGQTFDYLGAVTGVSFLVDWDALAKQSVYKHTPVTLSMQGVPAKDVIDRTLEQMDGNGADVTLKLEYGLAVVAPSNEVPNVAPSDPSPVSVEVPPAAAAENRREAEPSAPLPSAAAPTGPGGASSAGDGLEKAEGGTKSAAGARSQDGSLSKSADPRPSAAAVDRSAGQGVMTKEKSAAPPETGAPVTPVSAALPPPAPAPTTDPSPAVAPGAPTGEAATPPPAPKPLADELAPAKPGHAKPTLLSISAAERDLLARRFNRDLLLVALAAHIDAELSLELAATATPTITHEPDGTLRVTLLLVDDDSAFDACVANIRDQLRDQMREENLTLEHVDRAHRLVVAKSSPQALLHLGLLDAVRRLEPFRGLPDRNVPTSGG